MTKEMRKSGGVPEGFLTFEGPGAENLPALVGLLRDDLRKVQNDLQREREKRRSLEREVASIKARLPKITGGWEHPFWKEDRAGA